MWNRAYLILWVLMTSQVWADCPDFAHCLLELERIEPPTLNPDCIHSQNVSQEREAPSVMVTRVESGELPSPDIDGEHQVESDRPQWWKLTLFGAGLLPIEFLVSTSLHEGAHALAAELAGADVTSFRPYPHVGEDDVFRFGAVRWTNAHEVDEHERALVLAAPMFLDTAVLATYGGLVLTDTLPDNRYAQVGMWVFAFGHWVDLTHHMVAYNDTKDTARLERYFQDAHGVSEVGSRFIVRGSQALVVGTGAYFLYRGARSIFADEDPSERREEERVTVTPSVSRDFTGLTIQGQF